MFWRLLFAHFLGDYPLQTSWMAAHKSRLPVLLLHASVHFVTMLMVTVPAWRELWPYLLVLATTHLCIDFGKITLNKYKPQWVSVPYLIDQSLHYLSLAAFTWWIGRQAGDLSFLLEPHLAVIMTAYLLVTYVWAISERVLTSEPKVRQELTSGFWPRIAVRALLFTGLLGLRFPGLPGRGQNGLGAALPYFSGQYAGRALLTDGLVVAGAWLFVLGAFSQLAGG